MSNQNSKTAFSMFEMWIAISVVLLMIVGIISANRMVTGAKFAMARSLTAYSPVRETNNLVLWLETTSIESFNGTPNNNTSIATWYDINNQTAVRNNATQGTLASQPIYVKNVINGLPALFFGSTSGSGMNIADTLNVIGDYTVFIVFNYPVSTSNRAIQGRSNNWVIGPHTDGTNPCVSFYAQTGWVSQSVIALPGKFYIAVGRRSGSSSFFVNGVDRTVTSTNIGVPGLLSLSASGAFNQPLNGYIAEVIIFSRALKDTERVAIENYLSKKWGIKLG